MVRFKIDLTPVFDDTGFSGNSSRKRHGNKLLNRRLGSEREGHTLSEAIVGKTLTRNARLKGRLL